MVTPITRRTFAPAAAAGVVALNWRKPARAAENKTLRFISVG